MHRHRHSEAARLLAGGMDIKIPIIEVADSSLDDGLLKQVPEQA
jgi:hypothetical protein